VTLQTGELRFGALQPARGLSIRFRTRQRLRNSKQQTMTSSIGTGFRRQTKPIRPSTERENASDIGLNCSCHGNGRNFVASRNHGCSRPESASPHATKIRQVLPCNAIVNRFTRRPSISTAAPVFRSPSYSVCGHSGARRMQIKGVNSSADGGPLERWTIPGPRWQPPRPRERPRRSPANGRPKS